MRPTPIAMKAIPETERSEEGQRSGIRYDSGLRRQTGVTPGCDLLNRAASPAIAEMRNAITPLRANFFAARHMVKTLAKSGDQAAQTLEDLEAALAEQEAACVRLQRTLSALDRLLTHAHEMARLDEVIDAAAHLALHRTKVVGGVEWSAVPHEPVRTARPLAVSVMVAAHAILASKLLARGAMGGLFGTVHVSEVSIDLELRAPELTAGDHDTCAEELRLLGDWTEAAIEIGAEGEALRVRFVK